MRLPPPANGYYVAVPPDPTEKEMEGINAALRVMTRDTPKPN